MNNKKIIIILFGIIIMIIIKQNFLDLARVTGNSMLPNLKNNNFVLVLKNNKTYNRFNIIVLKVDNKMYIKRIIGLPGENIYYRDNKLYVNDIEVKENFKTSSTENFDLSEISPYTVIPNNKYLVLGDNRIDSYDSRDYGLVDINQIYGKVLFK